MPNKWVVDDEYPAGHLVPMTRAEEAQLAKDRASGVAVAKAQAKVETEAAARAGALRKARKDLAAGVIFASFSAKERSVIDMLLRGA